jgi:DNA-binding protein
MTELFAGYCPMFRKGSCTRVKTFILASALLVFPGALLAQRGAGGGRTGGGTAGGGGLSSTGRASGVDEKDDLKDFHATLAVQGTSQQIVEYAAMVKSTEVASMEVKALLEQLNKQSNASEIASRGAAIERAVEKARMENKKFLDGFSEQQKFGLKEIIKGLAKADADLAQQAQALNSEVANTKAAGQPIANSARSLERALTSFRSQQIGLGEEMSIGAGSDGQDSAFSLSPVKNPVSFGSKQIVVTTSGTILKGAAEGAQSTFTLKLTADLSDLQQDITGVLHAQLDKAERCGERIEIRRAALTPLQSVSLVMVELHFERWSCRGGGQPAEMAEGNGTIEVKLTPSVVDGTLRLTPEIARVDATGLIGELLRSGSPGEALRDEIMDSLLFAIHQGADFNTTLPAAARGNTTLHGAQFQGSGSRLLVLLESEIRLSNEQAASMIEELKTNKLRTDELRAGEAKTGELKGRTSAPAPVQATTPR